MIRRRKIAGRYLSVSVFCFGIHAASVWLVALLVSILGNLWVKVPNTLTLIAMSITLFMFYLHMIVNGRVYRYMISNERKERKREEGED